MKKVEWLTTFPHTFSLGYTLQSYPQTAGITLHLGVGYLYVGTGKKHQELNPRTDLENK